MPILDITVVGAPDDLTLASRLADTADRVLHAGPGRTWVRLHRLARADYAESGGEAREPVFVSLLLAHAPPDRAPLARELATAIAEVVDRPSASVHILFEPPGAGRVAFGGVLTPAPERTRVTSGAKWESIVGYSRAVRAGDHIAVTGTTSFDDEGKPFGEGDAYAQAKRCLVNIERALSGLGASLDHVVRTRMFVTDIARDWEAIGRAHAEVLGHVRPATTMVEIEALIEPWMLVEIEADAFLG